MTQRFLLESTSFINTTPIAISYPKKLPSEPPTLPCNGYLKYGFFGSTHRGGTRRAAYRHLVNRKKRIDPNFRLTTRDAQLGTTGGNKGDEDSPTPSPVVVGEIRKAFPLFDVYGINVPFFMGGGLSVGIATSTKAVPLDDSGRPKYETLHIIRRTLLSDTTIGADDIDDWGPLAEEAKANRFRSQLQRDYNDLKPLYGDARAAKLAALSAKYGREFPKTESVFAFLGETKAAMTANGMSVNSEGTIQEVGIIPPGTEMEHFIDLGKLGGLTEDAIGLYLWGWHEKNKYDPVVGGLAARGCGGMIHANYNVRRFDDAAGEFVDDCVVTVKPYEGIRFIGGGRLQELFERWADADIRKFSLSYTDLVDMVSRSFKGGK